MYMKWLSYVVPQTLARPSSSYNPDIRVQIEKGSYKLLVNGSRESGPYIAELWQYAMNQLGFTNNLPVKKILILGVAGGTVIHKLHDMFPDAGMTGVDIDPVMIDIGKKYFGLGAIKNLLLVVSDANEFVAKKKKSMYDLVILDVFIGREIPDFASSVKFLQLVKGLLKPGGRLFINYLREEEYAVKAETLSKRLSSEFGDVRWIDRYNNRFFMVKLTDV